jgi:hypothetical protein
VLARVEAALENQDVEVDVVGLRTGIDTRGLSLDP